MYLVLQPYGFISADIRINNIIFFVAFFFHLNQRQTMFITEKAAFFLVRNKGLFSNEVLF